MKIYRIEHPSDKKGPYRDHSKGNKRSEKLVAFNEELTDRHNRSDEHPGIHSDTVYKFQGKHVCGFPDLRTYKLWFYGFRAKLRRNGFVLVELEIDDDKVIQGLSGKQLAYDPKDAKILRKLVPI